MVVVVVGRRRVAGSSLLTLSSPLVSLVSRTFSK